MLEGVVPFPPDFAARYRAKGYWEDKSLRDEFAVVFQKYGPRVCVIDRDRQITYAELDRLSTNLALNLLELGFKPLDRVVPTLPNVAEFVILYFALQKIGCIPIDFSKGDAVDQIIEKNGGMVDRAVDAVGYQAVDQGEVDHIGQPGAQHAQDQSGHQHQGGGEHRLPPGALGRLDSAQERRRTRQVQPAINLQVIHTKGPARPRY